MVPHFLTIMANGDIWVSLDPNFVPTAGGAVLSVHRINGGASTQKIGTVSGNAGSYAVSGGTGKAGKEIV